MTFPIRTLAVLTALTLAGTAMPSFAAQVNLSATLLGTTEVPPNDAPGTGSLTADYDSETNVLNYNVTFEGLTGAATAAHFHGPASPEETAPPVLPVEDLESPITGTATLTDDQEADLLSGLWYFNLHTAQYPDGELRGQVFQSMMSSESSMMSSEDSSMMSSSETSSSEMSSSNMSSMSSSVDVSASVSVSTSVDPSMSSVSSGPSSAVSDASSGLSSTVSSVSSAVSSVASDVSSTVSSALDTSVSGGVSASAGISTSVAP